MTGIDASAPKESAEKAALLRDGPIASWSRRRSWTTRMLGSRSPKPASHHY
jgi:hypothetical protein